MIGPITMNTGTSWKTCSVVGALDVYGLFTVHGVGNMIGLGTQWPASPIDIVGNTNIAGNLNVNNGGIYKLNGIDIFSTIYTKTDTNTQITNAVSSLVPVNNPVHTGTLSIGDMKLWEDSSNVNFKTGDNSRSSSCCCSSSDSNSGSDNNNSSSSSSSSSSSDSNSGRDSDCSTYIQ